MTVLAGQMTQTPSGSPEWVACDGSTYAVRYTPLVGSTPLLPRPAAGVGRGDRTDYVRRVGNRSGSLGVLWRFRVPYDPSGTWYVKLEDDTADATLVNPPTAANPPSGVRSAPEEDDGGAGDHPARDARRHRGRR
jgi:hypothetical protein